MYMEERLLHGFTEGTPLNSTYWSLGFSRPLCCSREVEAIAPLSQYLVARTLVERSILFTPILPSQVIIYNWHHLPNKQTMLDELVVMVEAAEKVLREDKEGGDGDQNGEANGKETPSFGHLIILTRDIEGKAKEIEDFVLGMEQTQGLKHKEKLKAGERNLIREGLESAFESITFHTMPCPHPDIAGRRREVRRGYAMRCVALPT